MSFDHLNGLLRTQRQRLQAGWDVEREMFVQKQHELQNQLNELNNFKNTINEVFEARKAEWEKTSKSNEKKLKDDLEAKWKTKVGNLTKHIEKLEAKKQELTEKMKKMEAENSEMNKLVEKMKNEEKMKQQEIDNLAKMMKKMELKNAQLVEKVQKDEAVKQETAKFIDQMTSEMEELKKLHNNEMAQIKQEKEESELRCNGLEKQLASLMKQNVGDHQIERRRHHSKREHQIESENNEAKVSPKRQKIDSNATPLPVKNETKPDNFDADDVTYIGTTKRSEIKTPKVPFVAQQQNSQMSPSPIIQRGIVGSAVTLSTREKLQNAESQKMANQQPPAAHPSPQQIGHSSARSNHSPTAQTFGNCMDSRLADLSHRLNQLVQQEMPMPNPYKQP